jgi:hypothetical protein
MRALHYWDSSATRRILGREDSQPRASTGSLRRSTSQAGRVRQRSLSATPADPAVVVPRPTLLARRPGMKAARALLGEEHGATVPGETALAAARKALELLSIGLIAAGLKRPDP